MDLKPMIQQKTEQFDKLSSIMREKIEQHEAEITEIKDELLRLQGEYRILVQLDEESKKSDSIETEVIE